MLRGQEQPKPPLALPPPALLAPRKPLLALPRLPALAQRRLRLLPQNPRQPFVGKLCLPFKAVVPATAVVVAAQWFPMAIALPCPAVVLAAPLRRLTTASPLTSVAPHPRPPLLLDALPLAVLAHLALEPAQRLLLALN
jgi:hypothetical protein